MNELLPITCVIGPTASGKSAHAVALAREEGGEVISVDSRQVYRTLDIGTEKISTDEMAGIPHHLIDIREPEEVYSAGDFVADAGAVITDLSARGKTPILAGGTHFYFDALIYGLPTDTPPDSAFRAELEPFSTEELFARLTSVDPARAETIDPENRRRLIRALEIANVHGQVPERARTPRYAVTWIIVDPGREELKERLATRLESALSRGLVDEVRRVRERVGDMRLEELGLEYRIVGAFLKGELSEAELFPTLLAKLSQYARRQRAWMRKLQS